MNQKRYEALRAYFTEDLTYAQAAQRVRLHAVGDDRPGPPAPGREAGAVRPAPQARSAAQQPTVIITNDDQIKTRALVAQYARRMTIEQRLAEIITHPSSARQTSALTTPASRQLTILDPLILDQTPLPEGDPVPHASLESRYLEYLDALNDRRFSDLDQFVQDELTYNDEVLTRQEYADMIAADTRAVPDLRFDVRLLLTNDDVVACRLWFDCTPTGTFFGLTPTGRRISFCEHVFYRFRAGRIAQVWSLIDRDAVATQLTG